MGEELEEIEVLEEIDEMAGMDKMKELENLVLLAETEEFGGNRRAEGIEEAGGRLGFLGRRMQGSAK